MEMVLTVEQINNINLPSPTINKKISKPCQTWIRNHAQSLYMHHTTRMSCSSPVRYRLAGLDNMRRNRAAISSEDLPLLLWWLLISQV